MLYLDRRTQFLPLIRLFVGKKQPFAFVPTILLFNERAAHHKKYQSSQLSIKGLHAAKTGWKPNKRIAQSNALGTGDPLFCALKEQKESERRGTSLAPFALTARQLVNYRLPMVLPWAIFLLGLRPVFARNRLLEYNVLKCYLAGSAPSLLETAYWCTMSWNVILRASPRLCSKPLTDVQCLEVLSCGLRPAFVRNINGCTLSWTVLHACQRHNIYEICVICESILQRNKACENM